MELTRLSEVGKKVWVTDVIANQHKDMKGIPSNSFRYEPSQM